MEGCFIPAGVYLRIWNTFPVGASQLAMVVNDNAGILMPLGKAYAPLLL